MIFSDFSDSAVERLSSVLHTKDDGKKLIPLVQIIKVICLVVQLSWIKAFGSGEIHSEEENVFSSVSPEEQSSAQQLYPK